MTGISAAAEAEDTTAVDAVDAIEAVDDALVPDAIDVTTADGTVTAGDTSVDLSADAADGVVVTTDGADLTIGLPFAEGADAADVIDGTIVYDNNNGSTTTPLVHDDGSVQILTTIADDSAPVEYSYDFGAGAEFASFWDGSAAVLQPIDGELTWVGTIAAPWAVDASGVSVPTWYETRGTEVVQMVDLASPSISFPVVAGPTYWWGWENGMSNSATHKVIKSLAAAAGVAGVAAALQASGVVTAGSGAATAVAAALIAFGASALDVCNWNGRGVTIRGLWTGQFWCWPKVEGIGFAAFFATIVGTQMWALLSASRFAERASSIAMPLLFVGLAALVIRISSRRQHQERSNRREDAP